MLPRTRARRSVRRRRVARRARVPRIRLNPSPTFTETLDMGPVVLNYDPTTRGATQAGWWGLTPASIPQIDQYSFLYNQICFRKIKLLIVPVYNFESQSGAAGVGVPSPAVSMTRLTYAIQSSGLASVPPNEITVLQDNGCKIRMMNKPLNISFTPVANLNQTVTTGTVPVAKKNQWITMTASGLSVLHGGVSYWFTQDYSVNNPPVSFHMYAKVTFSLRDPK